MAIVKNDYSTLHLISPYYITVEQDAESTDIIIITDTVNNNEPGELHTELEGDVIWLRIRSGETPEELTAEPENKEAIHSEVEKLDSIRLRLESDELFLIQYNNPAKNDSQHRESVTGFQMSANDIIYVKIDNANDALTIYQIN